MAADGMSTNPDYAHFAAIPWCAAHLGLGPAVAAAAEAEEEKGPLVVITPCKQHPVFLITPFRHGFPPAVPPATLCVWACQPEGCSGTGSTNQLFPGNPLTLDGR